MRQASRFPVAGLAASSTDTGGMDLNLSSDASSDADLSSDADELMIDGLDLAESNISSGTDGMDVDQISSGSEKLSSHGQDIPEQGMECDSCFEREGAEKAATGWRPGKDCGGFDGFYASQAAQVVLTNVYLNARRLTSTLSKAVLSQLLPMGAPIPKRNFPDRVTAALAGVSHSRGRRVHDKVRANNWAPLEEDEEAADDEEPALQRARGFANEHERLIWAMRVRVQEALHISRQGLPDTDYARAMKRLQSHGLILGEKYLDPKFVERTEAHCVAALQTLTANSLDQLVPSLGIPADLVIVHDGVSIGARMFSRYETMMLIGVVVLQPTEDGSWSEVARLLAAPSAGQKHTGSEQAELILGCLAEHPFCLTGKKLKAARDW